MTVPRMIPIALVAALLAGCAPGTPDAGVTDDPVVSAPPTPTPSATPEPEVDVAGDIAAAMNSGDTAALEGYLAPSVHVTYAASEYEGDVSDHALVIQNLTAITGPGITWDFDLPASVIDDYASNPGHYPSYVDDFPSGAVVGRSSDGKVVSFALEGGVITRVFIALDEFALTFA
jgi:hypothetical protein